MLSFELYGFANLRIDHTLQMFAGIYRDSAVVFCNICRENPVIFTGFPCNICKLYLQYTCHICIKKYFLKVRLIDGKLTRLLGPP